MWILAWSLSGARLGAIAAWCAPLALVLKGGMAFWRQDLGGQIMPFKLQEPPAAGVKKCWGPAFFSRPLLRLFRYVLNARSCSTFRVSYIAKLTF
jgi:hypothetical protein